LKAKIEKMGTFLAIIFAKSAKLLKAAKILKSAKLIKVLITGCSMLISAAIYSFQLGWWFAIGLVLMLFIHEMGHVMACIKKKLPTSAPLFIPMLGAVIFVPKMRSRVTEAYVGIGGPLVGGVAAVACFGLYWLLPDKPVAPNGFLHRHRPESLQYDTYPAA